MKSCRRGQLFVDREVQGTLMLRVVAYWLFCLLTVTLMLLCWNIASGPPRRIGVIFQELYTRYAPALAASLVLLPLVMIDVVRLSGRFAGPIYRLRGALRGLAEGQDVRPVKFRDNDYWQDLAGDFNRVAARLAEAPDQEPAESIS
jgi:hypothetical protein